ncbi:glycosyltransferase involved in cell wall biosynthesis [Sphingomonas jinjuensis]|uniref:Glycosyltransferase involved in cell wall biosynthesis n=1 Tax=Sphingomonas jinjuensis TaxID=535907 RepID=A0A840FPC9_9SPHN|nr:glycosyltransferase involved in cell wall biosynthesis [Sphingomonas jinjuensis]
MRILFLHQNFPAQFRHLAPQLAARGHELVALTFNQPPPTPGTRVVRSSTTHATGAGHPWARDFDTKIIRAEAALQSAKRLRDEGFHPDLIIAHPGWGDALFVKDVWPKARFALYCEFFYAATGTDWDFDPEFRPVEDPADSGARSRLRNLPQRMLFDIADAGISPTQFQASTYPPEMRERIMVCHDGIDTAQVAPGPAQSLTFSNGTVIEQGEELITFVNRNIEPYRGFHSFVRALPSILERRPNARVLVVGRDGTGYGAAAPQGTTWRQHFMNEIAGRCDTSRILFVGALGYSMFLNVLRMSTLHVYLTYPFVLSWSLMEAMATGCAILGSDTAPVREFISDGKTGRLVDFFDHAGLADRAVELLGDPAQRARLGAAARARVIERADLHSVVLPRQLAWVDALLAASPRVDDPPV